MTDRWLVLEVLSPSAEQVASLSEGLIALGATAVVEEGDRLSTWLPAPADNAAFVAWARQRLEAAAGNAIEVRWSIRAGEDWDEVWRRGLEARRVSERLIVTPTWIEPDTHAGDIVLRIDPQMAFGTGEHASTRGALRLIEATMAPGARVLDVGTGSAILSIAAALLGAEHVDAVDCDAGALPNARENVERHACADRIALQEAFVDLDYLAGSAAAAGPYDLIVANVMSGVLIPLQTGFRSALRPTGALILAGILTREAECVVESAAGANLRLVNEVRDEDWWAGAFSVTALPR
ncbi:MAG: 50S ribosomal protein L11 methyltransferase [Longimicrobiales bacterium]